MSRSDWGFIGAVVGCLIIAAGLYVLLKPAEPRLARYEQSQGPNANYRPGGPSCEPSAIAKLSTSDAASKRDTCENAAEQHRLDSDDLVQQTRAADAAREGVLLSYTQSILALAGVILGLFTLVAAAAAAWFAGEAARYTAAAHASFVQSERGIAQLTSATFDEHPDGVYFEFRGFNAGKAPLHLTGCEVEPIIYDDEIPPVISLRDWKSYLLPNEKTMFATGAVELDRKVGLYQFTVHILSESLGTKDFRDSFTVFAHWQGKGAGRKWTGMVGALVKTNEDN